MVTYFKEDERLSEFYMGILYNDCFSLFLFTPTLQRLYKHKGTTSQLHNLSLRQGPTMLRVEGTLGSASLLNSLISSRSWPASRVTL